jgi:hypothetical protein
MLPPDKYDRGALIAVTLALVAIVIVVLSQNVGSSVEIVSSTPPEPHVTQAKTFNPWQETVVQYGMLVISALALLFLFRTWREAAKSAHAANKAVEISEQATKATVKAVEQSGIANKLMQENALADRRPWLSLSCEPFEGLKFDDNGYTSVGVRPTIINHGRSPALQVNFSIRAKILDDIRQATSEFKSFREEEKRKYLNNQHHPFASSSEDFGSTLFPGMTLDILPHSHAISKQNIDANLIPRSTTQYLPGFDANFDYFSPIVFCVVSYRFYGSEEVHQTAEWFQCFAQNGEEVRTPKVGVNSEKIYLQRHPLSNIAT